MKPICYNPDGSEKKLTSGQRRRIERAIKHNQRKENGYHGSASCHHCGGTMTWCDICNTYSSYCCETYGTCMCS